MSLFLQFLQSTVLAGHICCLVQFDTPHCPQRLFFFLIGTPVFFDVCHNWTFLTIFFCCLPCTCLISRPSIEQLESFNRSYIYSCIISIIASMVMLLFRIFFLIPKVPVDLPMEDKNFNASNSTGVPLSNSHFFSVCNPLLRTSSAVSFGSPVIPKNRLCFEICFAPV